MAVDGSCRRATISSFQSSSSLWVFFNFFFFFFIILVLFFFLFHFALIFWMKLLRKLKKKVYKKRLYLALGVSNEHVCGERFSSHFSVFVRLFFYSFHVVVVMVFFCFHIHTFFYLIPLFIFTINYVGFICWTDFTDLIASSWTHMNLILMVAFVSIFFFHHSFGGLEIMGYV